MSSDRRDNVDAASAGDSLFELLQKVRRNLLLDLNVAAPGTVDSYSSTTQTANVTLGFLRVKDGEPEEEQEPLTIPNVRVAWQKGATFYDHAPLARGDTGLLVFTDRALRDWYAKGGSVDPVSARAHSLADAVFFPGLATDANAISPAPPANTRVIEAPAIQLGETATTEYVLLGTTLATQVAGIASGLPAVATDPGTTQALANALRAAWSLLATDFANAVASKVRAE